MVGRIRKETSYQLLVFGGIFDAEKAQELSDEHKVMLPSANELTHYTDTGKLKAGMYWGRSYEDA